jgi:hypothetical protein
LGFVFAGDENPDSAGAVDGLNLYIYVGNNPLKYIDQTGQVKVYPMDGGEPHELDVLSPIEGTYRSDNLFDFPESYEKTKPSTAPAESGFIHLVSQGARYLAP